MERHSNSGLSYGELSWWRWGDDKEEPSPQEQGMIRRPKRPGEAGDRLLAKVSRAEFEEIVALIRKAALEEVVQMCETMAATCEENQQTHTEKDLGWHMHDASRNTLIALQYGIKAMLPEQGGE